MAASTFFLAVTVGTAAGSVGVPIVVNAGRGGGTAAPTTGQIWPRGNR